MRGPKTVDVRLDLKFFSIGGVWKPTDDERKAAWELYAEVITRVSVVPLRDGIAREALTSLYALFAQSRDILRRYGPELAEPRREGQYSLGFLTVAMLNLALRPVLSYWHPELQIWEARRPESESVKAHEDAWPRIGELRDSLEQARSVLMNYSALLAQACGVPDLGAAINAALASQEHATLN